MFPVFGGEAFSATLHGMSHGMGIPVALVFLAIVAEFFGSIALVFSFLARIAACGITAVMLVVLALVHARAGFFMNWATQAGKTEGFEYHLLVLGIRIAAAAHSGEEHGGARNSHSAAKLISRKRSQSRFAVNGACTFVLLSK